jgi:16S rRNA G1207 methylase RsmC
MAPEEAQQNAPRRRGRPPGSKNKTTRARADGRDLVGQLNSMVAELIKKNRQLQRQVASLTARVEKSSAGKTVERGIKTLSRRVQRALGSTTTRARQKKAAPANGRRKRATTRRRRSRG